MLSNFLNLCWARMAPVVVVALVGFSSVAHAGTISGPTLSLNDSGYQYAGLGFTATLTSLLTSFTFENQGQADTVILVDSLGNILNSVATPGSTLTYTASVSWSLTAGTQYYLLQSTLSNARYASWNAAAPSDADIALTNTGDFSLTSPASANFTYGGSGASGTLFWAAFSSVTTNGSSSGVPEPGTYGMIGLGLTGLFYLRRRNS
jgi:PEP-CTERM motif-containing protein